MPANPSYIYDLHLLRFPQSRSRRPSRTDLHGMSGGGGALFGALPDEVLNHVLSFLPSREAVQASLLARRWRHLWRSTQAISVREEGDGARFFVNALLLRRRDAAGSSPPLRSFELDTDLLIPPYDESQDYYCYDGDGDVPEVDRHVDLWIDHALSACRARSLTVRIHNVYTSWRPRCPLAFASEHLTTLHLEHVHLADGLLDFARCPALRQLTFVHCHLEGEALVSPSLERLSIVHCGIEIGEWEGKAITRSTKRISTPSLRCLQLTSRHEQDAALFLESESIPWMADPCIQQRAGEMKIYSPKR
uniref:Uncharacterized protein n=1 Tax=Avena sativa TaxID=4498 RepID=A0ACD5WG58_AVESA